MSHIEDMVLNPTLIASVQVAREDFIHAAAHLSHAQSRWAPEGKWSISQIVEHIVRADQGMMVGTFRALEDFRSGRGMRKSDNPHHGMSLEEILKRTWKGPVKAPQVVEPSWGGPVSFWLAQLAANQHTLEAFANLLGEEDAEDMVFPHGISGPVNVLQRIEFMRFHMDHHRHQIEAIKAMDGFPIH